MSDDGLVPGGHRLTTPGLVVLAAVAFVVELALFGGVGAVALRAAGGGVTGWVAALAATAAVLVLWGVFMAPRGRRRLAPGPRTALAALLVYATAVGLVLEGFTVWGWFLGVAGVAVVVAQTVLQPADPGGRAAAPR